MAAIQVKTMQETLKKGKKNNFKIKHPAAEKQTAKSQEFSQKFSQKETLWNYGGLMFLLHNRKMTERFSIRRINSTCYTYRSAAAVTVASI